MLFTFGRLNVKMFTFHTTKRSCPTISMYNWLNVILSLDPVSTVSVCEIFFLLLRTTDDDSTTQKKVTLLLEKVNKVKWKTSENVEEEENTCLSVWSWCLKLTMMLGVSFFTYVGLCSWGEAPAGEAGSAGDRSVWIKAKTGNRD